MTGRGELIAGRYGLTARIGDDLWQGRDQLLGRIVAVRQLPLQPDEPVGHRDGQVAAQPRHPNAVMVHDAVEQSGRYYLVMEHFPARNLTEFAEATGPLTEDAVARIGIQVADAMAAAHDKGIVHGDVRPDNILVGPDGAAKITGFGISRSPEDGADAGFASDVSALGATLRAALPGGSPLGRRRNPITTLLRMAAQARRRGQLTDVLRWMQRPDPDDRPTMQAAHDALAAVVAGSPTGASEPEPQVAAPRPALRSRLPVRAMIVGVVLLATAGLVGTLVLTRSESAVTADPPRSPGAPASNAATTTESPPDTAGQLPPLTTATTSTVTPPTMQAPRMPTTTKAPEPPDCVTRHHVTDVWPGGYRAEITVVNKEDDPISGWIVRWTLPDGHTITNLWDGHLIRKGPAITVINLDYNGRLRVGGYTVFGYTADAPGDPRKFADLSLPFTCQSR